MKITKIIGLKELKKILGSSEFNHDSSEMMVITDIIKTKDISNKDIIWTKNKILLPSVNVMNMISVFDKEQMDDAYIKQLYQPECFFVINETIFRTIEYGLDFFFMCAIDEEQYRYIKVISRFIQTNYGIKLINTKKYLEGKKCKLDKKEKEIYGQCIDIRNELVKKLRDSNIDPVSLLVDLNDKKLVDKLDRETKLLIYNRKERY